MLLFYQAGTLHPLYVSVDAFWTVLHFLANTYSSLTSPSTVNLRVESALLPLGISPGFSQLLFQLLNFLLPVLIPCPAPLGHFEGTPNSPIFIVLLMIPS